MSIPTTRIRVISSLRVELQGSAWRLDPVATTECIVGRFVINPTVIGTNLIIEKLDCSSEKRRVRQAFGGLPAVEELRFDCRVTADSCSLTYEHSARADREVSPSILSVRRSSALQA